MNLACTNQLMILIQGNRFKFREIEKQLFSEYYELNEHLEKVEKRKTEANRNELKLMGDELKRALDKTLLKHGEFHNYVATQLSRLE